MADTNTLAAPKPGDPHVQILPDGTVIDERAAKQAEKDNGS